MAPWLWFPRKTKHVGAAFIILVCFNNSTFHVVCVSWIIVFDIIDARCNYEDKSTLFYRKRWKCHRSLDSMTGFVNVWVLSVEILEGQSLGIKSSHFRWSEEEHSRRYWHYRIRLFAQGVYEQDNTRTNMYWFTRIPYQTYSIIDCTKNWTKQSPFLTALCKLAGFKCKVSIIPKCTLLEESEALFLQLWGPNC